MSYGKKLMRPTGSNIKQPT